MPVSKNALIRYKTIDRCLQNHYRRWTLDDLIEECSKALYEYEGRDEGVSRRTVQLDIQMMRSDKLGYNAPIKVVDTSTTSTRTRTSPSPNPPCRPRTLRRWARP